MKPENRKRNQKKQKLPLTRGDKILRGIIIALSVILALILTGIVVYNSIGKEPEVPGSTTEVEPTGTDDTGTEVTVAPSVSGDRKEHFYTFLVVGRDQSSGNTDTIMLVSYDVDNQKVNVMSIPRDTMVNVSWDIKKINSVYNVGGADMLKEEVSKLIGFEPDYTIYIDLDAFGVLVDTIGGVDFEIPFDMYYDDPLQDLSIHFDAGMTHLTGDEAMRVIRFRQNNDGTHSNGDVGRISIQQDFMTALIKQCLSLGNLTKIPEFAGIFEKYVETELTTDNLIYFGKAALNGLKSSDVNFVTLPYTTGSAYSRTYHCSQSYVLPIAEDLIEMINESFNPYLDDVTADNLDIMSVNSSGKIASSTGVLEDKKATTASSTSTTSSSGKTSSGTTASSGTTSSSSKTSSGTTSSTGTASSSGTTSSSGTASSTGTTSSADTTAPTTSETPAVEDTPTSSETPAADDATSDGDLVTTP